MSSDNNLGLIFNIQKYSLHDGPGIRTVVFLKGCPLKCLYCCNPESQKGFPELVYNRNKCIGITECISCIEVCFTGAIKKDGSKVRIDRELCSNCLQCAKVCPAKALNVFGNLMSIDEVLKAVEEDNIFYARSGGGLTLSGGEPLFQPEFTLNLLKEAKKRHLNTAMETSGYANWEVLEGVCKYLNTVLYDIKCLDDRKHTEFTGVSNALILDNFRKMCSAFPSLNIIVRTPLIPTFNDNEKDIFSIVDFIKGIPNLNYELLRYHRFGQPKYDYLGCNYLLSNITYDERQLNTLKEKAVERFLTARANRDFFIHGQCHEVP